MDVDAVFILFFAGVLAMIIGSILSIIIEMWIDKGDE